MAKEGSLLDVRLIVYFYLTTLNSVLDVVFQEETYVLSTIALMKCVVCYNLWRHVSCKPFMAACLFSTVAYWVFFRSPAIWDSTVWSMQTDCVVALWLWFGNHNNNADLLCNTIAQMFCCYYAAAGVFKINSHFMDPDASCATVFFVQHVTYYLGNWLSHETIVSICATLKPWAPSLTLVIELSMAAMAALGQLMESRLIKNVGLILILYFHLAVCLTPEPLDISMFALQCGSRLIMAVEPTALASALRMIYPNAKYLMILALVWTGYGVATNFTPLNWSFAGYVPVLVLHTMAIHESDTTKSSSIQSTTAKPLWSYVAIFVAFFYSFGTIILGLQEEGTCNMFANLKIHGGSNHYIFPTGLLLTGNEIRIQQTNSWWLTTTYPADLSHTVEPEQAASVLKAIGTPAPFYFNGGANRVLGLFQNGYVEHNGVFVPYTVPDIEFKRLFGEAIVHDKSFTLEYVELPGRQGDEHWRATASQRTVKVNVEEGKVTRCRANGRACTEDDLVYRYKNVSWLRRKFSMYHGYPIVFDTDGRVRKSITCFGP